MNPPQVYMCSPSWTLLPSPSPYHPSGSSKYTSPKHPVSYIEPGLATRFIHDILHVSMPFSQIFLPSPSPTESIRLIYSTGVSALASFLPKNTQDWSPLEWTGWTSLQSKGLSGVFSNTTVQKHQFFGAQLSSQSNSHPYMTTGKTIALTRWTFVGKVMSLLFNMLSRLVITFLPRS